MTMVRRANMGTFHSSPPGDGKAPARGACGSKAVLTDHAKLRERVWRCGQHGASPAAVLVHAGHQRVHALEFQLLTDEADEGDVQPRSVLIAVEIEQEHFEQRR